MVDDDSGAVRTVAWSEILPWLSLFRCFRLAIRFRALLLSAAAILLTLTGWAFFGWLFSAGDPELAKEIQRYQGCPWLAASELVPDKPGLPASLSKDPGSSILLRWWEPFVGSWEQLGRPVRKVFDLEVSWSRLAFLLLCGLWALAVWAFFGGALTRVAAVELARGERIGWGPMTRHACSKWRAYFAAPLFPLLGLLLVTVPIGVVSLLLRANLGVFIAAVLWPLLILVELLMALLLLGLAFGWPLMWATISAEGTDSFDALSRSYAYVFQRPLHYLFYAVVVVAIGILGWLLVSNFAAAVVYLSYWGANWGMAEGQLAFDQQLRQFVGLALPEGKELANVGWFGWGLIRFWGQCVKLFAVGFLYSYFWTAATAIYFLLRRDVDATEMDEVFLEEEEREQTYGLPPLEKEEEGAPAVKDEEEESETSDREAEDEPETTEEE